MARRTHAQKLGAYHREKAGGVHNGAVAEVPRKMRERHVNAAADLLGAMKHKPLYSVAKGVVYREAWGGRTKGCFATHLLPRRCYSVPQSI